MEMITVHIFLHLLYRLHHSPYVLISHLSISIDTKCLRRERRVTKPASKKASSVSDGLSSFTDGIFSRYCTCSGISK